MNAQTTARTNSKILFAKVKDPRVVHLTSTERGTFFERPTVGDFAVNVTGTTTVS